MADAAPSWDLYRTFLAVLREGSLSGAARSLGLTQPTAGRHVDALEAAVGVQLFTRSREGLAPTEAALELRPHAEAMAATAAALLRTASGPGREVRGAVRVSASEVVGVEVLPPILAALRERHPGLVLELTLSDAVEDLLRRDADIAVRMVAPRQGALRVRRLGGIPLGLHAHRSYLARQGTPRRVGELAQHSLVGYDRETPLVRSLLARLPAFRPAHFAFRSDSTLAQLAAIRAGLGIGICQVGLAQRDPALVRVLPTAFHVRLETWLAMHEDLRSTARFRAVFDGLAEGLASYVER
jgi:DNA-binding transcriptional LysR family regulator